MKEQPHRYHIHITSEDKKAPRGFKLTSVILEKRKVIQEHNMFTRTFVGTVDVQRDIEFMKSNFSKMFTNIQRFKIELLDEPVYLDFYNDVNYREVHIKLKIAKDSFEQTKDLLKQNEDKFEYSLSNNPKEITEDYITQFVNKRYMNIASNEASIHLKSIIDFLTTLYNIQIKEVKEEISIYDTNFDLDKWWTE